jgi:hypothetical protein
MPKIDRLKEELEEFNQSYKILSEKLAGLREEYNLETRSSNKLRLKNEIEKVKSEREEVGKEIDSLEKQIGQEPPVNPDKPTIQNSVRTILILSANPVGTAQLRLGEEVREIEAGLNQSKYRGLFILKQQWATRVADLRKAMLNHEPNIVHFSGHGDGEAGICLENDRGEAQLVSTEALADFFKLFADKVECVLLNACYSEVQAEAIVQHIPYVIGMNRGISDGAAIEFAVAFYDALGAGKDIEFAFDLGRSAIQLQGIPEDLTPVLKKRL